MHSTPDPIPSPNPDDESSGWGARLRRMLIGAPRDLRDRRIFHSVALIPLLAWVGLGADGLSSSAYGPDEAFRALGAHTYLALGLAGLTGLTVVVLSAAYRRIIEDFPHGGGGYVVATKLLGEHAGLVAGAALLVDYVLTITVSIAAAGDALFSFMPLAWHAWKFPAEFALIAALIVMNIRGVKESVLVLTPIFILFLITHGLLVGWGVLSHVAEIDDTAVSMMEGLRGGVSSLGIGGLLLLFLYAYSMGGGTYTGIEAVSNGLAILREPRVENGKRTMVYMGTSLAVTAGGLLLCYLLWRVMPVEGKTLNAVLVETVSAQWPGGRVFALLTLVSEGALLIAAAQTGFIGGPRVMANMAVDRWMPHRMAALSDRLTTANGVVFMGAAALAALLYTGGHVTTLVVMYSINVFVTFTLSMIGMTRLWTGLERRGHPDRRWRIALFSGALLLCAAILGVTVYEKFGHGGWVTLAVTSALIALCLMIRRHYRLFGLKLKALSEQLGNLPNRGPDKELIVDPNLPTAAVLVGGYTGLGIHTVLNIFRIFPGHYRNLVFLTVGVIDSGMFKGYEAIEGLRKGTQSEMDRYVEMARRLGIPATYRMAIGTDAVDEAIRLCHQVTEEFPRITFFAGQVVFQKERWYDRLLHNQTAYDIQKQLIWLGHPLVILPARMHGH